MAFRISSRVISCVFRALPCCHEDPSGAIGAPSASDILEDRGTGNGKTEDRDMSSCIWVKGLEGWETSELFQLGHGYRKHCFRASADNLQDF